MASTVPREDTARAALKDGDWETAQVAFEAAVAEAATPEALDGLGLALWWRGDVDAGIERREQAYAAHVRAGNADAAVRIAVWLSREFWAVHRNPAAADGWLARAEGLLEGSEPSAERGWIELARARRADDPVAAERHADAARRVAREHGDRDLEIQALARRGVARVAAARVDAGIRDLDQALAAATGGEGSDPEALGEAFCALMEAAGLVGDLERFMRWSQVLDGYLRRHEHLPLMAFCGTCAGEVFAANGRWGDAEAELERTVGALDASGHRSRCVEPAARLADLRVRQGRLEEAQELLRRYPGLPETAEAEAALHLARGEPTVAARVLERRLGQLGRADLAAVPLLSLLVEAQIAGGDVASARAVSQRLAGIASASGVPRVGALAALAAGRVAHAGGDRERAMEEVERALGVFDALGMPLEGARARLQLARIAADGDQDLAVSEARAAMAAFEDLGATIEAGKAGALLRELGVRGQTGPKGLGLLTRREGEVLRLLSLGLTNAEIASRLFISVKTVGNHVSNILAKLGVRTRTEAAAVALRDPPDGTSGHGPHG